MRISLITHGLKIRVSPVRSRPWPPNGHGGRIRTAPKCLEVEKPCKIRVSRVSSRTRTLYQASSPLARRLRSELKNLSTERVKPRQGKKWVNSRAPGFCAVARGRRFWYYDNTLRKQEGVKKTTKSKPKWLPGSIPYGVSRFAELRREGSYYVDFVGRKLTVCTFHFPLDSQRSSA